MGAAAGTAAGLGLQYLLRGLLSAFISMIADAADMIGGGVVTLLQPEIGGGSSIFRGPARALPNYGIGFAFH